MSNPMNSDGPKLLTLALLLAAAGGVLVWLAWIDVLPGGWTLRGLVEPHAVREARKQRERSDARLALFAAENPEVPAGAIVFLGSSSMERYPLDEHFSGVATANRGIGSESAPECLARLARSLPAARPGGFVLYLASIDFRKGGVDPPELTARVARLLDAVESSAPGTPFVLIGLLSERDADGVFVERLARANAALEALVQERGGTFLSTSRPPLQDAQGRLPEGVSADELHLNGAGYRILTEWLLAEGGPVGQMLDSAR